MRNIIFTLTGALLLSACGSGDSDPVPFSWPNWAMKRTFEADGNTYAPADFRKVKLAYNFDLGAARVSGLAQIDFQPTTDGRAYFLSGPEISAAKLDGKTVAIETRRDPDNLNSLRAISTELKRGEPHQLELAFDLPASKASLRPDGLGFITAMSDIGNGNYFEAYSPSNFENDSFQLSLTLEITGVTGAAHSLFANGSIRQLSPQKWELEFPDYYTSSSFYVHLTDTPLFVKSGSYQGKNALIPLTVYSRDESMAAEGLRRLPSLFAELEETFGPYAHESFTAYISGSGGMEHVGATVTSLSALGHELTHSWFARGVMPSDGRSGWIDEAVASWRDNGYFRAAHQFSRAPANLGRFSAFQRFTPANSYRDGRLLLSELDLLFTGQGGLRPVLGKFFAAWKRKTISTNEFRTFLEQESGASLHHLFQTYVYGADSSFAGDLFQESTEPGSLHPPALTEKDILRLR